MEKCHNSRTDPFRNFSGVPEFVTTAKYAKDAKVEAAEVWTRGSSSLQKTPNTRRGLSPAVTVCSLTRMTCGSAFFQANEIISRTQALARGPEKAEASFTHS